MIRIGIEISHKVNGKERTIGRIKSDLESAAKET